VQSMTAKGPAGLPIEGADPPRSSMLLNDVHTLSSRYTVSCYDSALSGFGSPSTHVVAGSLTAKAGP